MAKPDEISSTERLLELIRSNGDDDVAQPPINAKLSFKQRVQSYFSEAIALKNPVTVGIDIGYDDLKLVKINQNADSLKLIDYLRVPFEPDITPSHPKFVDFLRSTLTRFCGDSKSVEIWSNISSARVELRYLTIPKVPPKQIANAVYWSHRRVAPFDEKESIFDYQVTGDVVEEGTPKIAVASFTAPKLEIQTLKNLFAKSNYPLSGIAIIPFALQNLLKTKWMNPGVDNVSSLYIGRDWSRIDIISDGNLVLSRGIKAGMKTMNEAMRVGLGLTRNETFDENFNAAETPVEKFVQGEPLIESEKAQEIFYSLIHDASASDTAVTPLSSEEEKVFQMIMPALKRLVRQVELTFDHYAANFENKRVEKIYVSSTVRPHRRLVNYLGKALSIPSDTFDPFNTSPEHLQEIIGPESAPERGAFTPAVGIALSNNAITPNFLYTYKEKAKVAYVHRLVRFATAGFLFLLALCFGYYFWQSNGIEEREFRIRDLKLQLERFRPRVDQNMILSLVDKTKEKNEIFQTYSQRYLGIVVITEISNITPSNIRLRDLAIELGGVTTEQAEAADRQVVLEGIVLGDRNVLEASLANYLIALRESPLFDQPVISEKSMGALGVTEVLQFIVKLKMV